jgi:hypothetical protein
MYSLIFLAAFLTSSYLWHTRREPAARVVLTIVIVAGCIIFSMSLKDAAWHDVNSAYTSAMITVLLVELYIKLGRFEVKAKK